MGGGIVSGPPGGASAGAASNALPYTHVADKAPENGSVDVDFEKNLMRTSMRACLGYAALFVAVYVGLSILLNGATSDPIGEALTALIAGG